jgi:hypothetical protein
VERHVVQIGHFHAELLDPTRFALVLNPTHLSTDGVVATIVAAWEAEEAALAARSHGAT